MKISVITVCLNDLQGLKNTLQSIITQTYNEYELIVIDGGSNDGSKEYIESINRINQWVSEPDKGIYNAMNKAITMAHGEYCIFMNAGDRFYNPHVLARIAPSLNGKDFYVGGTIVVDINNKQKKEIAPVQLTVNYLIQNSIFHQSTFTKISILKDKLYSENYKIVSDWKLFFEVWLNGGSYAPLKQVVSYYYLGGFSYKNYQLLLDERKRIIEELIPMRIRNLILPVELVTPQTKLEKKIAHAMRKPPIQRDLKLLRNAFKWLIKDIFIQK